MEINKILQALEQAKSPQELNKAVDYVLANMLVKADDDFPDDVAEGRLSPRAPPLANVAITHIRSLLIELNIVQKQYMELQKAYNKLQTYVNTDSDSVCNSAISTINSRDDAIQAGELYGAKWFSSLPYSIDAKIQTAQALIDTCSQYDISNGFWNNLVEGKNAATDFAKFDPK
jgi:hypothetical protein